ncbi:hypothetical protein JCGZ_10314 [Jatropha curcas]|uniref:Uncharacterized protein n=1 Tax=Jatropha curcas TaxID=180498 RepID=A0A067KIV5_JATCU|nr:hypothetical protein JCGZ_10314 [Jatropha curcas]
MTSPSHSSDEDFLESLGISLDEVNVTADTDTHASVTGIYAQAPDIYARYRQGELTATQVPVGLVSQMMELILGMQEELTSSWTLRAFDDQRRRRPRR